SASSKLLYSGLRYFLRGRVTAARDAVRETRALEAHVAPGLIRRVATVVSVPPGTSLGARAVRSEFALRAYGAMAASAGGAAWRVVSPDEARGLVPSIAPEARGRAASIASEPRGTFVLTDEAQLDDTRLVLATALAAADLGAAVINHARVTAIAPEREHVRLAVRGPEGEISVVAKSVVNASGAWIDVVRRMEDPHAVPIARLVKGVQVVLSVDEPWGTALSIAGDADRIAMPWHGGLLVGVAEAPFDGPLGDHTATEADIDRALIVASELLPAAAARRDRIRAVSAGLYVHPRDDARVRQDTVTSVGRLGVVTIAGGTLTTHRLGAMDALQLLPERVRPAKRPPSLATIVAAAPALQRATISPSTMAHLASMYGDRVADVLAVAEGDATALERIHPDGPDIWAQVRYAIATELATTVDDITDRRTSLRWRGLADETVRERIARMLLPRLVPS
ncbi:MAG TPA: FAD-dependent oxidoreductase, partial [Candidatus Limnocylindrales bacterium]|nr:FAD-dependent oxidoreductase [Candidatus Limnocylindrales bacterium]